MGLKTILENTVGGGNGMGGGTETTAAPTAGHRKGAGRVSTGWSDLMEAVEMFEPEEITQEFSKKLLKWQAEVGGISTKCATFKIEAVEAANFWAFVGMVKGDAELKYSIQC